MKTLPLFCLAVGLLHTAATQAMPDLVVLVRHAEKSETPKDDPGLSPAGQERAEALADALEKARVTSIITTSFRRTRETAAPLARRLHLMPQVVAARGDAHVPAAVAAIRAQQGNVLVVGHSNTVARIASALGAQGMKDYCETTFGLALLVAPGDIQNPLPTLRYGAAEAAPQTGCQ